MYAVPEYLRQAALLASCLRKQINDSSRFVRVGFRQTALHLIPIFCIWKSAQMFGSKLHPAKVQWAFERLGSWYPVPEKPGYFRCGELSQSSMQAANMIVELTNSGQFDVLEAAWEMLRGDTWEKYLTDEEVLPFHLIENLGTEEEPRYRFKYGQWTTEGGSLQGSEDGRGTHRVIWEKNWQYACPIPSSYDHGFATENGWSLVTEFPDHHEVVAGPEFKGDAQWKSEFQQWWNALPKEDSVVSEEELLGKGFDNLTK